MRKVIALLLLICLIFTMTGCSQKENTASGPVTITVWHDKEDAVIAVLEEAVKPLQPDINVVFEKKSGMTESLKLVGNDKNAAPDMYFFAHDKIGVYAEMGVIAPITDFVDVSEQAGYVPITVRGATYKGKVYQMPLYFETLLFMYNKKYMKEADIPTTTEQLYSYMERKTKYGHYGFVEQHSTPYYAAGWIHGFGGTIIDNAGVPFPDAQAVKDALNYHSKFVALMPGETEYNTVNTLFLEGKADATIGGPWMVPSARAAEIDLGIAPMPTVDSTGKALAPYSGVQGIHVLNFAAEQKTDAVKKLLAVLTDPTIGIDLALASGCAPANALCYDDERVANDELVQSMRTTAEIAVPMPNIPEMDVMWTVVGNLLTDVNLSGKDINESFDAALKQANQLIDAMK